MGDGRWEMGDGRWERKAYPREIMQLCVLPPFPFSFLPSLLSHKKEVRKKWKK